jgi:mannitol-1-phosphate 5-dehydrogenase
LFVLEAYRSGNFDRFVVSDVVPEIVAAVRRSGGKYWINVAEPHRVSSHSISGLEIYNTLDADDQAKLLTAIAAADEIATALPSVDFFERGPSGPAALLARGLRRKLLERSLPSAVVYVAENHNRAAERLREAVRKRLDPSEWTLLDGRVQFVDTVIGKMCGVIADPTQIVHTGVVPLVDGVSRAVLVEQFNRILISQIVLSDFQRGITVFQEKPDLLPFEEAKLYGHNAAHALLGYLANRRQLEFMHEANDDVLLGIVEHAFLDESGAALCQKHAGLDTLFTPTGWSEYVQDLLVRMVNPHLQDRIDRVTRDPRRKLGWDDRLIGTIRMALAYDVQPRYYALGAASAVELLMKEHPELTASSVLSKVWGEPADSHGSRTKVLRHVENAREELRSCHRT